MHPGECLEIEAAPADFEKFVLLAGRRDALMLRTTPLDDGSTLLTLCKRLP